MDMFGGVAESISGMREVPPATEVGGIVTSSLGHDVNCYPGHPTSACFPEAFFISLQSKKRTKRRQGFLSCRQALEHLVQHMLTYCEGRTRVAVLITDNWDADAYDQWFPSIEKIKQSARVEAYLITNKGTSQVNI
jgi:hypothetical protein